MPADPQATPSPVETSPELMAARRVSVERIRNYTRAENPAGQNGAITREVGRVASRDPEFALQIAYGLDITIQPNALAVIGEKAGDVGALSNARDIAKSSEFKPSEQSGKLSKVAEAAIGIDPFFAFETAMEIPLAAKRADTLINIAGLAKFKYIQKYRGDSYRFSEIMELRESAKDSNFSLGLFRRMVREADRTIDENKLWDEHRNHRLARVSAGIDLRTTYQALLRSGSSVPGALFGIEGYVKNYIDSGLFGELKDADPSGELIVGAFRNRVERIKDSEEGRDDEKTAWRLSLSGSTLDPVVDATELLKDLNHSKSMTFQNLNPELYRELLAVIRDGASAQMVRFDEDQKELDEAKASPFDF